MLMTSKSTILMIQWVSWSLILMAKIMLRLDTTGKSKELQKMVLPNGATREIFYDEYFRLVAIR